MLFAGLVLLRAWNSCMGSISLGKLPELAACVLQFEIVKYKILSCSNYYYYKMFNIYYRARRECAREFETSAGSQVGGLCSARVVTSYSLSTRATRQASSYNKLQQATTISYKY